MARFDNTFDATTIEPVTHNETLPAGRYRAQIVESEIRVTRNGMGQYLWLMLEILEGQHQGRKLFDQLNLKHPNQTTVEIAQRTLSAICHATGKLQVHDSAELHNIPMEIQVGVRPPQGGYGERNTIRYLVPATPAQGAPAEPVAARPTAAPAQQSAPPRPATPPWRAKS